MEKLRETIILAILIIFLAFQATYEGLNSQKYAYQLQITQNNLKQAVDIVKVQRSWIKRDDKLLNFLLHDTWDRTCVYEVIPWEPLADGNIRQSLIQHCGEEAKELRRLDK